MPEMKDTATSISRPAVTVIGDLVSSRTIADRAAVHRRLETVLASTNVDFDPDVPLRITVGDEFQGIFTSVGHALQATLRLRVALLPVVDVRQGIGWGPISVLRDAPRVEDGPGWWAARSALEMVEAGEGRSALRGVRTGFAVADGAAGPDPGVVNAALMMRDQMVGTLSARSMSVLRALMKGQQQQEIAGLLGISASAVSQRVRADGLGILLAADEMMGGIR